MKSIVVTLFSAICYIQSIHSNEIDQQCLMETQRQGIVQRNCMDAVFNPNDFLPKANRTIIEYDGDDSAVRRLARRYCPILNNVVKCLQLGLNVSEVCRTPMHYQTEVIRFRVLGIVLDWACDNDAAILIEILQHDGLKTFMFSNDFHRCGMILSETSAFDPNASSYVTNPEYCTALGRVLECYKDLVRLHKNQNLTRLAGEIYERVREVWGC